MRRAWSKHLASRSVRSAATARTRVDLVCRQRRDEHEGRAATILRSEAASPARAVALTHTRAHAHAQAHTQHTFESERARARDNERARARRGARIAARHTIRASTNHSVDPRLCCSLRASGILSKEETAKVAACLEAALAPQRTPGFLHTVPVTTALAKQAGQCAQQQMAPTTPLPEGVPSERPVGGGMQTRARSTPKPTPPTPPELRRAEWAGAEPERVGARSGVAPLVTALVRGRQVKVGSVPRA